MRQLTQKDIPLLKIGTILIAKDGKEKDWTAETVVKVVKKYNKSTVSVGVKVMYIIKKGKYRPDKTGEKVTAWYNELYMPTLWDAIFYILVYLLKR